MSKNPTVNTTRKLSLTVVRLFDAFRSGSNCRYGSDWVVFRNSDLPSNWRVRRRVDSTPWPLALGVTIGLFGRPAGLFNTPPVNGPTGVLSNWPTPNPFSGRSVPGPGGVANGSHSSTVAPTHVWSETPVQAGLRDFRTCCQIRLTSDWTNVFAGCGSSSALNTVESPGEPTAGGAGATVAGTVGFTSSKIAFRLMPPGVRPACGTPYVHGLTLSTSTIRYSGFGATPAVGGVTLVSNSCW